MEKIVVKEGDTVRLRNGGTAKVTGLSPSAALYTIIGKDEVGAIMWTEQGRHHAEVDYNDFDIVEVIRPGEERPSRPAGPFFLMVFCVCVSGLVAWSVLAPVFLSFFKWLFDVE